MTTPIALTIAGSDSGGGAGIQADLKTFSALGVFGASVLTAVTAQNTHGVRDVEVLSPRIVGAQIDAVMSDLAVGAIKIGMAASAPVIETIAGRLAIVSQPVVLDPVMVATAGDRLLAEDAVAALREGLVPLATLVTPNLPEAALLSGLRMAEDEAAMARQAEAMMEAGARAVLIKGGHLTGAESVDLLFDGETMHRLSAKRVATRNDHGTGCTLSAAIAARLALGDTLQEAVSAAKDYLTQALAHADELTIGSGRGPVHHFHRSWPAGRG
jgi:hydroxymethylpyrimidine/phosphomethylpyrimidine kinase